MADRTSTAESLLHGVRGVASNNKSFREQLADEFKGSQLVTIKNVLDREFGYVYTDPADEQVTQPDRTTRRVEFGDPKARVLQPNETVTVQGWEAYIGLTRMWKEYAQRDANVAVTMSSPQEMTAFISKAYVGVFDPNKGAATTKAAAPSASTEDLGFGEDHKPKK